MQAWPAGVAERDGTRLGERDGARRVCARTTYACDAGNKMGESEFEMPMEMERGLRFEEILSSYFLILLEKDYSEKTVQQELINVLLALILYYYNCWKHYYRPIYYIINSFFYVEDNEMQT